MVKRSGKSLFIDSSKLSKLLAQLQLASANSPIQTRRAVRTKNRILESTHCRRDLVFVERTGNLDRR